MTTPTTTELQTMLDQATPGPWVWEHWDGNDDNICRILHWRQAPAYAIGDRVADEVDKPADARLIAAAPELAAEVLALREERATMLQLIRDMVDPDPCWFDHNGGCQAHVYLTLKPGELCPHAEAKALLGDQ